REPAAARFVSQPWQEAAEPDGKLLAAEHAAHEIGLAERRGEKVVSRGLVADRSVDVARVPRQRTLASQRGEAAVAGGSSPIERQRERESALSVKTGADRPGELG